MFPYRPDSPGPGGGKRSPTSLNIKGRRFGGVGGNCKGLGTYFPMPFAVQMPWHGRSVTLQGGSDKELCEGEESGQRPCAVAFDHRDCPWREVSSL